MSYYAETPTTLEENNVYSYPFPYGFVPSVYYDPYTYPITPQSQPSQCSQPGPLTASPAVLFSQPESVYPESGCLSVDSLRPSPTPMYHSPMPMYASPTTLYHPPTPSLTTARAQSVYDVPPQQQHSPGPSIFPPAHDLSMQYEQYRALHKVVEPSTKKRSRTAQACEKCRIRKAKCTGLSPCNRCIIKKLPCVYATTNRIRHKAPEAKVKPPRKRDKPCQPTALGLELYPMPEPAYYQVPEFRYRPQVDTGLFKDWPQ